VSASSSAGVFRISLEWDGKLIRNYDGSDFPTTLSGALEWQHAKHISYGWHTLTFLAYDKERNVSQTSILVYHARPGSANHGSPSGVSNPKHKIVHKGKPKPRKRHHRKHH
jgi:hypothetical protein